MTDQVREGGCGCGQVRYRVSGAPIFVNNCHCRQCQRQTGSTSVVNAFFETGRVTLTQGELTEHTVKAGSGGPHVICRCAACGVALWSYYPRFGRLGAGVRVGTLDDSGDDSGAFTPDAIVHVAEKMPWVPLPEGIPAFEAYYNPRELLKADKLERFMELWKQAAAPG